MPIQYKLTADAKKLKLISDIDVTPRRVQEDDAGFDLCACIYEDVTIYPFQEFKFPTGVHVWMGKEAEELEQSVNGTTKLDSSATLAGLFLPRSGCKGLQLTNTVGLLDAGYQHECFIKYKNISDSPITIQPGQRIAQLIIIPVLIGKWDLVEEFSNTTERSAGDGSSGDS